MDGWAVGWVDGRILDMITGVVGGGDLDGPDVRMNERTGLWTLIWLGTQQLSSI